MAKVFHQLLDKVLSEYTPLDRVWFAGDRTVPPEYSCQVNFPRLELVLEGHYPNLIEGENQVHQQMILRRGEALYIPPNCWTKPDWHSDCSVLSLQFSGDQLGMSLVSRKKHDSIFFDVEKYSVQTEHGYIIDHIISALNRASHDPIAYSANQYLLNALLIYSQTLLDLPGQRQHRHSEDLYHSVCIYIQENFHHPITRDMIAEHFEISSSHLSRLFRQQGKITLAEYINQVRIERASYMLKRYGLKSHDVALRCGFNDANYFFRVFKSFTGHTPSAYRTLQRQCA